MARFRKNVVGKRIAMLCGATFCGAVHAQDPTVCALLSPEPFVARAAVSIASTRESDATRPPLSEIGSRTFGDHRGGPHVAARTDFLSTYGGSSPFSQSSRLAGRYPWQVSSDNRLRVLSLWRSAAGSLSLQAGHGREASLQWTVPLGAGNHRQGVLDRWITGTP